MRKILTAVAISLLAAMPFSETQQQSSTHSLQGTGNTRRYAQVPFTYAASISRTEEVRFANRGDSATGQLDREAGGGQLRLNVKPCGSEKKIIVFQAPYANQSAGQMSCEGRIISLIQVTQK
jgi:hypothetical protein